MNVIASNIMIFELVKTSTGRPPCFTLLHGPVLGTNKQRKGSFI